MIPLLFTCQGRKPERDCGDCGWAGRSAPPSLPHQAPCESEPGFGRASQDGPAVPGSRQGTPQPDMLPPGQVMSQMPCRVPSPGLLLWSQGDPVWALVFGMWGTQACSAAQAPGSHSSQGPSEGRTGSQPLVWKDQVRAGVLIEQRQGAQGPALPGEAARGFCAQDSGK